ncbi:Mannosylglycerate hydrolase [Listeria monocytogenes N53-1]|nr:Mannosylglycerate hydrolase [Listeria monocytogenes]CCQ22890.1 Mannosylglycerate hydrolase [Listeria monocytogenes N53-1]
MVKAHIVNHTHWDREWYFTSADALVLSEQLFTEVIDELKKHPEANFVLDGQLSILDDYVALYPEKLADINNFSLVHGLRKQMPFSRTVSRFCAMR